MQRSSHVILATAGVGLCLVVGQIISMAQGKTTPLMGAWKVTEVTRTGARAGKMTNPQPGLYIFTASHYAIETVNSDAPRPDLPPADKRTDKQVAEAFNDFTANAGSYETKGSELTTRIMVAKNPATMKLGRFQTFTFRLEGKDTLWLTQKANDAGPAQNPTTVKLTRIE